MWSPDGKELFYLTGDAVVAVAVRSDGTIGAPRRLFDRSNYYLRYGYDVSPDGTRFLMIRRDEGSVPRQLDVILNWPSRARKIRKDVNHGPARARVPTAVLLVVSDAPRPSGPRRSCARCLVRRARRSVHPASGRPARSASTV